MSDIINSKEFLATVSRRPGVYQMYNAKGEILYVGKAKNLKKRLASYFRANLADVKTAALMSQVAKIETIITNSENEALLLENNLIKTLLPHYNIIFKDDKSFPYLFLTDDKFPRLIVHRGTKSAKGTYFGPFPSANAVHESLNLLQKVFKLRQCNEVFFHNRQRPCLQFQIGRCTAPCVGNIDVESYQRNVDFIKMFLSGKSNEVVESIIKLMENAATKHDYELAAFYRDQIQRLKEIQQQQCIVQEKGDIDIIALAHNDYGVAINVISIRKGVMLGSKSFYHESKDYLEISETLATFLVQYYFHPERISDLPQKILINQDLRERTWIENAISEHCHQHIKIVTRNVAKLRANHKKWIEMAELNANQSLTEHFKTAAEYAMQLKNFSAAFELTVNLQRIECFDVSHTFGEATVASCVVFSASGPLKKEYRKYNINDETKSDDYAALGQALTRRFTNNKILPDVLMIDGGKGQLNVAKKVLADLKITSNIFLLAVAKGPERKAGMEEIFLADQNTPVILAPESLALHFIQRIRDEAHRFAITAQRKKYSKARKQSILDNISGIGAARRNQLLKHFGGLPGLKNASVDDLAKISGISKDIAQRIYAYLHSHI